MTAKERAARFNDLFTTESTLTVEQLLFDALTEHEAEVCSENSHLRNALEKIAAYDSKAAYREGRCHYGCDSPSIAKKALNE